MANKLYVGNLPFTTTKDDLEQMFGQVGTDVDAVIINDRFSGRSKGFGFVEMSTAEESQKAIDSFNGQDFNGRAMVVNEARPPKERSDRGPRE